MDDLRGAILRRLADGEGDPRFGEPYFPMETAKALDVRLIDVYEAIQGLQGNGLLFLDPAGQGGAASFDNWRWRLSEDGRAAARSESWEPRDPQRYLARLRDRAPTLDPVADMYVTEALRSFNARCFLASSVMLGVAAEHVFGRVAEAFVAGAPCDTEKLRKLLGTQSATYHQRFNEFRKRLEPIRPSLPDGLADSITLDAVADLLRVTRNAAGHPSGRRIDEDTAYTHLNMAGVLLAKMLELAEHFERLADPPG
ncbi:MAG TPA: hypothetical protein VII01_15940 [Solirubrobacteraceae bacterium]